MKREHSQDAVTSTYAFIIAVGIITASILAVYGATNNIASRNTVQETEQVNLQSEAAALQLILLDSPGIVDGGAPWDEAGSPSADDLVRLGLMAPDLSGVQIEKLRNLRLAPFEADATDGFANYEEVRTALGLDDKNLDFHIRTKPTLKSVDDVLADPALRDPNLLVTYIADVDGSTSGGGDVDDGLVVDDFRCEASPAGGPSWRFSVDITNGGLVPTQFFVVMDIDGGNILTRQDQTGIALAGQTVTVSVDVENVDGFTCDASTTAELDVLDPTQLLRATSVSNPAVGVGPASTSDEFWATTDKQFYAPLETVRLSYYGDVDWLDPLSLEVRQGSDPSGLLVHSDSDLVAKMAKDQYMDIFSVGLLAGDYTAYLEHDPSGIVATQRFTVGVTEPVAYAPPTGTTNYDADPAVAIEIQFLHDLVVQFCPTYYDDQGDSPIGSVWLDDCAFKADLDPAVVAVQPGDIFPDLKPDLRELETRLLWPNGTPRYDITNTLVVGSNVAHNTMTDNLVGDPIEEWVLGGGTLIVFGSPDQSTQWLQNLFHVGQSSSSGGISAPDVSHPLLSIPEQLAYDEYDTTGYGWDYSAGADEFFTDVVQQGGTAITAVSDPGDFGEGTIVLSSWRPYDLFGSGAGSSSDEGIRLMYNFLTQGYRDLFLDYGPPLPDNAPAIPSAGRAFVNHPDVGPVTLDFTLYVFPSS